MVSGQSASRKNGLSRVVSRGTERIRFGLGLLAALARPESTAEMTARIAARTRDRVGSFLERLENDFWISPRRPYRALLELAGWTPESVRLAVAREGLEPTLALLAEDGVYLDSAEAKGRRAIVRGSHEISFAPHDLEASRGPAVPLTTSGSSGPRATNSLDLDGFRLQASYMPAMFEALEVGDRPLVLYYPANSAAGIAHLVSFALAGRPPAAWFCHVAERAGNFSQWRLWRRSLVVGARLRGVRLPVPRLAAVERPSTLVDWLVRQAPRGAVVATFPGSALRVLRWARAKGVPLPPLTWILGGEPVSPRKRAVLEEEGHRVYAWYGSVDCGRIGIGCLRPEGSDDMHLLDDRYAALVRAPDAESTGAQEGKLFLTSLVPEVHRSLLNVDTGDLAELTTRRCGCPFESLGLLWHVRAVHSAEKLTVDGVTLSADIVHALASDLLPASCGGSPADYQLLEQEDGTGLTRLVVRVDPAHAADEEAVCRTVYEVLVAASGGASGMAERLRRAGAVSVRREPPALSHGGKALGVTREESSE